MSYLSSTDPGIIPNYSTLSGLVLHCANDWARTMNTKVGTLNDCIEISIGDRVIHLNEERAMALVEVIPKLLAAKKAGLSS